ncbi:MAG: glycoside hydrolase family 57 protein [Leptospiraceae bacterium]|nr:glycoside hydrolase family 57 protein [Leptospiraceae bacterium]
MISICFYFEVHQPYRLRPFHFLDIGQGSGPYDYFDDELNRSVVRKVAEKCYMPATNALLELVEKHQGAFHFTFSITGIAIEQFRMWAPEVLENFRKLARTGCVEFLAETYYHSLSSLYSEEEFRDQVHMHMKTMRQEFGVTPQSFRNTELIYSNHIAWLARSMGFQSILLEGAERILDWRSPNYGYHPQYSPGIRCMLKNYRLSDDIAFRFGEKSWSEYPLTADKFARWVHAIAGNGTTVNLFMDFETLGEHQWAETGIFEFLRSVPTEILRHQDFRFRTITESLKHVGDWGAIDTDAPVSWADTERDLTAWLGNSMQREAIQALFDLEAHVRASGDPELLDVFRRLQTSDHFYYMCTKYFNDGDVHKYFSPYNSPHDAYVYFMNALYDFRQRVEDRQPQALSA